MRRETLLPFNLLSIRILPHNRNRNHNRNRHRPTLRTHIRHRHMPMPIIPNTHIFHLIRTSRLSNSPHLGHQVELIPRATPLAVLLHLILAVDLVHRLRRPHLISRPWHLISRLHLHLRYKAHLHPLYKVPLRTAFRSFRHQTHRLRRRADNKCLQITANPPHQNTPRHISPC
jgi:hypothetical protein